VSKRRSSHVGVVIITLAAGLVLSLGLTGCGGEGGGPPAVGVQAGLHSQSSSARGVVLPGQVSLGDMDGDGEPSASDAQAIMDIAVGLADYRVLADADSNYKVEIGDALKVLRAASGEGEWPIGGGPPPPPPI